MGSLRTCVILLSMSACAPHPMPDGEVPSADPVEDVPADQLFAQGVLRARRGDLIRAEQYIVASIGRGYPAQRAMPILLRVCIAGSRYAVALRYAESHLRDQPDDWALRLLVATIHIGMGHEERARLELERVIRGAPDQPPAHYMLATLLHDRPEDAAAAESHFRRYLELAPDGEHAAEARAALEAPARPIEPASNTSPDRVGAPEAGPTRQSPQPEEVLP